MSHLDVLKFELEANKQVLFSENGNLAHYRRQYHHWNHVHGPDHLNTKSCASVVEEYETKHIPRRERFIEALKFAIERIENV